MEPTLTRLLLIGDDRPDAGYLGELLRARPVNFAIQRAVDGRSALAAMQGEPVDLILLDLDAGSGLETLKMISTEAEEVPLVVLSALGDEALATRAVQDGAQDHLVKGELSTELLVRAIRYAIERKRADRAGRRLVREQVARAEAEAAERRLRLLADVSHVVAAALDDESRLHGVAQLTLPSLADGCAIDLLEGKTLRRVALACETSRLASELTRPPSLDDLSSPLIAALGGTTQRRVPWPALPDAALPMGEALLVPLIARGRTLGLWSFYAVGATLRFGPVEVALARDLAERVALAVDNARLYREAQAATQLRDTVLAVVSHDLRDPLHLFSVALQMLRSEKLDPERARKTVTRAQHAVDRMNRLIGDLLDVARIQSGTLVVEPAPLALATLFASAEEQLRPLCAERSIELVIDVEPSLPQVHADGARLQQVLSNLVSNAVKFSGPGTAIVVRAGLKDGEVLCTVADAGDGIAAEDLAHIFDPFWQADRKSRSGAGLGLVIVKELVEAHRGRIWAESEPGRGTMIHFTLPLLG